MSLDETVVPPTITVIADTREKFPLIFPPNVLWTDPRGKRHLIPVTVETRGLQTGDYTLKGYESRCIIERKGAVREIVQNHFADRRRSRAAYLRLARSTAHPVLLLELSLADFFPTDPQCTGPRDALDDLLRFTGAHGISVWYAGWHKSVNKRRLLGRMVLHILLAYSLLPSAPENS